MLECFIPHSHGHDMDEHDHGTSHGHSHSDGHSHDLKNDTKETVPENGTPKKIKDALSKFKVYDTNKNSIGDVESVKNKITVKKCCTKLKSKKFVK